LVQKAITLCIVSGVDLKNCHAKYGAVEAVMFDLQSYVNAHISRSFDYLLMVCMNSVCLYYCVLKLSIYGKHFNLISTSLKCCVLLLLHCSYLFFLCSICENEGILWSGVYEIGSVIAVCFSLSSGQVV
jgi:hypothetical protein